MRNKFIYIFPLIFFSIAAMGQNLVRNPGFEHTVGCPTDEFQIVTPPGTPEHEPFKSLTGWYNINSETPEYFNSCNTIKQCQHYEYYSYFVDTVDVYSFGVPVNYTGVTLVDSGSGIVGLTLFGSSPNPFNNISQRREYISSELIAPLEEGEQYFVGFVWKLMTQYGKCGIDIENNIAINRLGILFTDTFLYYRGNGNNPWYPDVQPQLNNPEENMLTDSTYWNTMSWIYTAQGNEKIMTVGNFYPTDMLKTTPYSGESSNRAFYFLDNFCIININDPVDSIGKTKRIGVCPYDTLFVQNITQGQVWSTNDTGKFPTYDDLVFEGDTTTIWVKTFLNCRIYVDTYKVYNLPPGNVYNLDTVLCTNDTSLIDLQTIYPNLVFYDSSYNKMRYPPFLDNRYAGAYQYFFKLADSCSESFGKLHVTVIQSPKVKFDDLILKCIGDSTQISIPDSVGSIIWNTGETTKSITVHETGAYEASMTNYCGTFSDDITVRFEKCENCLLIPNAFSPNGDGLNDRFEIRNKCHEFLQYRIQVYDRWGQLMFTSYDISESWDGTCKGKPCDQGIYFFILSYAGNLVPESDYIKGEIHLIR